MALNLGYGLVIKVDKFRSDNWPAGGNKVKDDMSPHFIKSKSDPDLVYRTVPHMVDSVLELIPDLSAEEAREIGQKDDLEFESGSTGCFPDDFAIDIREGKLDC